MNEIETILYCDDNIGGLLVLNSNKDGGELGTQKSNSMPHHHEKSIKQWLSERKETKQMALMLD